MSAAADDLRARLSIQVGEEQCALPPPRRAPRERLRRRYAWRNERQLYLRECALTGRQIVSTYSPDKPFVVYEQDAWWSDAWSGLSYGREFDFTRPFFPQFGELLRNVPALALVNMKPENSRYNSWALAVKNCYMCTAARESQDCAYSHWLFYSRDCFDCAYLDNCELCYECTDCGNCYALSFSQDCLQCRDGAFLVDCIGCSDCVGCFGLRNQRCCVFNQQLSEAEYRTWRANVSLSREHQALFARKLAELVPAEYHQTSRNRMVEECSGAYLRNCRGCYECFDTRESEGCVFSDTIVGGNYLLDCSRVGYADFSYECLSLVDSARVFFSSLCWYCHDVLYCVSCFNNSHDLFGCVGLKHAEYCILNVSYSRAEYERLLVKIVRHLMATGEWGEFFSPQICPFGYNESIAAEYLPLSRAEALQMGYAWCEYQKPAPAFKEGSGVITCSVTGNPFRLTPQEVSFYERQALPPPLVHPDERHKRRIGHRSRFLP